LADEAMKLLAHSDLLLIEFARKSYVAAFELLKSKGIEPDVAIYIQTDFNTALERNRRRPQLLKGTDRHYVSEQEMIQTFEVDDFAELVQKFGEKVLAVDNATEVSAIRHAAAQVFQKIRSVFESSREL
jgi:thymidylate kinase